MGTNDRCSSRLGEAASHAGLLFLSSSYAPSLLPFVILLRCAHHLSPAVRRCGWSSGLWDVHSRRIRRLPTCTAQITRYAPLGSWGSSVSIVHTISLTFSSKHHPVYGHNRPTDFSVLVSASYLPNAHLFASCHLISSHQAPANDLTTALQTAATSLSQPSTFSPFDWIKSDDTTKAAAAASAGNQLAVEVHMSSGPGLPPSSLLAVHREVRRGCWSGVGGGHHG